MSGSGDNQPCQNQEIPKALDNYIQNSVPLVLEFLAACSVSYSVLIKLSTCLNCYGSVLSMSKKGKKKELSLTSHENRTERHMHTEVLSAQAQHS